MIIMEGPDLSGKTTLANRISALMGIEVYHSGGPANKKRLRRRLEYINYFYKNKKIILDRHICISEQIYGTILRKRTKIPIYILNNILYENNPLIFYCDKSLKYLRNNFNFLIEKPHKSKEHIKEVIKNYEAIYQKYESLMRKLSKKLTVVKVDFEVVEDNFLKGTINDYYKK